MVATANGWLGRWFSDGELIALGHACYGVGPPGAWVASSLGLVVAGASAVGAGVGLTMSSVDALLSDLVSREYRAGALSLRNGTTFLGRAVGPASFTGVAIETGYEVPLLAAGVVAAAGGVATLALIRADGEPERSDG